MKNRLRACGPSFFVLPALLFALIISSIEGYIFWWAGIVFLLLIYIFYRTEETVWSPLSIAFTAYISVLLFNALFLNPVFSAKGLYFIIYPACSFLAFKQLDSRQLVIIFRIIVGVFCMLAVWGLVQYLTGIGILVNMGRQANAIFYTPNTFASALNLVLIPLIVTWLYMQGTRVIYWVVLLLFATLLSTRSQGGYISFVAGMLFIGWYCIQDLPRSDFRPRLIRLLSGFIIVFICFLGIQMLEKQPAESHVNQLYETIGDVAEFDSVVRSGSHRFMLYEIAWNLIKEKPLLGHGHFSFQYYQYRDQRPPHIGNATRFVHNDYLQVWAEEGIIGLICLITVILTFYIQVLRYLVRYREEIVLMLSLGAGMTAYFVHAMGDFVLYPPVLGLLFGAYIAVAHTIAARKNKRTFHNAGLFQNLSCFGIGVSAYRVIFSGVLILLLSQPAIAQLAYDEAIRRTKELDMAKALPLFELARRFAPYETQYYWVEGAIWAEAAEQGGFSESAERADILFKKGAEANRYKMRCLFSRALLHRDQAGLLKNPATPDELISWFRDILEWWPHHNRIQSEYIRTLHMLGRNEEARDILHGYLTKYPDSGLLKQLESELFP